jgi:hypothetical protein
MNGTIVSITFGAGFVTGSVRVNEGDGRGPVEYVATVPAVGADGQPLSPVDIKAALVNAWRAQRASRPQPPRTSAPRSTAPSTCEESCLRFSAPTRTSRAIAPA